MVDKCYLEFASSGEIVVVVRSSKEVVSPETIKYQKTILDNRKVEEAIRLLKDIKRTCRVHFA